MKLTDISLRKPVFAWMIMLSFLIIGGWSLSRLGISEKPDIDFPIVNVSVEYQGASPEVMEVDVLDPLESVLLTVEGIKNMTSNARRGRGSVSLEFDLDRDIDIAVQEVISKIGQAQRRLPDGIDPPVVTKSNPEDRPILWLSITTENMSRRDLMIYVRDYIKDQFQTVQGVSEVILGGYIDPQLRIYPKLSALKRLDLTLNDIAQVIQQEHIELPAGIFEPADKEFNIRYKGEADSVETVSKLPVLRRGGSPQFTALSLDDIAEVVDGLDDLRRFSRVNGKEAIGIGIRKQRGSNSVAVARAAKEKMANIAKNLPAGLDIGVNYDGTIFIEDAVVELFTTLLLSMVMTALVIWLFLGQWSAVSNILLSIPTAIVATFSALYFFGFTLNTFTLLGLTLAVGLVVDDNIMILENIERKFAELKDALRACREGTDEISFAALSAALAIIAIFLPIGFVDGIIGKYFFQFAVTLSAAVCFSYIDAVTLTPMRARLFLSLQKNHGAEKAPTLRARIIDGGMDKLETFYSRSLHIILNHRILFTFGAILFFAASLLLLKKIPKEFSPAQDQGRLQLILSTPPGSSLKFTDEKVRLVENFLKEQKEIERFFITIGGFGGNQSNQANGFLSLVDYDKRSKSQQELSNEWRSKLKDAAPGIRVVIIDPSLGGLGGSGGQPIEVILTGAEWDNLESEGKKITDWMETTNLFSDIDIDFKGRIPELALTPKRAANQLRAVSQTAIAETLSAATNGQVIGKFSRGGRRYDIRLKLHEDELKNINNLKNLRVRNNRGETVLIDELINFSEEKSVQQVYRDNRLRRVKISANLTGKLAQGEALNELLTFAKGSIPINMQLKETGSSETFRESFQSLLFVFIGGLVIAYMILGAQFNSFLHPFTIYMAIPFALSGALVALSVTGLSLNIYSIIGLVLLMGLVKKNSIILVDYANQLREELSLSAFDAILKASPVRLRPIMMTSVSTIAGTLPAALMTGPGSETRIPLAAVVIGGMILSTLTTLFLVPCVYVLFSKKIK
jgi:hydrophobe/amphiphile efflux-1 (HAE1) family protein